jgi:diacylglycerol kinase family enzyme
VGIVGQGTGGDFRRSLGIEHRLDRYLEAIASGKERRVDAGRATFEVPGTGATAQRWFVNVLSAGLGGLVDKFVEAKSSLPPTLKYAVASARAIAKSEPASLVITTTLDGERTERRIDAWMLAVCNGTSFGSGMRVAPRAALDDGRFDVVALSGKTRFGVALAGRAMYSGAHLGREDYTHFLCDKVEITLAPGAQGRPFLLDVDGEPLGAVPLRIEVAPGALRLRA